MTKAIVKPAKPQSVPAVILFGMSETGKPRAGTFKGPDVEPALKAAQLLRMSVLKADSSETRELAAKLPAGRIAAKGHNIVPFVRNELYKRLADLSKPLEAVSPIKQATSNGQSHQAQVRGCRAIGTTSTLAIWSSRKMRIPLTVGGRPSSPRRTVICSSCVGNSLLVAGRSRSTD